MTCNPEQGFTFNDERERLLWMKYRCFEQGISPYEFRKCRLRDLNDVIDINTAVEERKKRIQKTNEAVSQMSKRRR